MASGNGSPGAQTVAVQIRIPKELQYAVDLYAYRMRCASTSEAYRRLLESHPVLTMLLVDEYTEREHTSPQPT